MCFVVAGRIRYLDLICICLLCLALMVCADFCPPPPPPPAGVVAAGNSGVAPKTHNNPPTPPPPQKG